MQRGTGSPFTGLAFECSGGDGSNPRRVTLASWRHVAGKSRGLCNHTLIFALMYRG